MKKALFIIVLAGLSVYSGMWISKHLQVHYFLEEYYYVLNLDPENEKDTEGLRQEILGLMEKKIPATFRPDPEHFQCFKIISEAVFFCNADTYRQKSADLLSEFFATTIPQEIGRMSQEYADEKLDTLKTDLQANKNLLAERTRALEKIKSSTKKATADEKKFSKINDIYKKNQELYQHKLDLLQSLYGKISNPDERDNYKMRIDDAVVDMKVFEDDYESFRSKNRQFADSNEQMDHLENEIDQIKNTIKKNQVDIEKLERVVSSPNEVGKVANTETFQLSVDPTRHKFETQYRPINAVWFSIVVFFLLSNLLYLFPKKKTQIKIEDDQTMIEGEIFR